MKTIHDPNLVFYADLAKHDGGLFMDESAYGRLCTVTGATWGSQGRTFDGTDDLINVGRITQIEGASALWTIQGWFKMTDALTANRCLFSYDDNEILGTSDLYAYWNITLSKLAVQIGGGGAEVSSSIIDLGDLGWHFIEMSKTATNLIIREDGLSKDNVAHAGAAFGASYTFRIGDNSNVAFWKGLVGDFSIIAGRTETLVEHQNAYQATKWRYR